MRILFGHRSSESGSGKNCALTFDEDVLVGGQTLNVGRPPARPPFAGGGVSSRRIHQIFS